MGSVKGTKEFINRQGMGIIVTEEDLDHEYKSDNRDNHLLLGNANDFPLFT